MSKQQPRPDKRDVTVLTGLIREARARGLSPAAEAQFLLQQGYLPPGAGMHPEVEWATQLPTGDDGGTLQTSRPFYRREHAEISRLGVTFGQKRLADVVCRDVMAGPWRTPTPEDGAPVAETTVRRCPPGCSEA